MSILSKNIGNMPLKHYLQYLIIGGLTTIISFGSFWILFDQFYIQPNLSNIISVMLAVTFAYFANKWVVFRSSCSNLRALLLEMLRYIFSRAIAIMVEIIGVFLLYSIYGLDALMAKIIVSSIVLVMNYLAFKHLVFRNKSS